MAAQGATLSDKSARQVYGLAQDEICRAIRMGKLQYREHSMHGSPWLRLLRREVQALVKKKYGHNYLKKQRAKTELARVNRELKRLKTQIGALAKAIVEMLSQLPPEVTPSKEVAMRYLGVSTKPCLLLTQPAFVVMV